MEHYNNDLPKYTTKFSIRNRLYRLLWTAVRFIFFRPFISQIFNRWRIFLLKIFGAKIGQNSVVYASANIWMPSNLEIGDRSCIGPNTFIYNPAKIIIGNKVVISQYSYLCGGSHDVNTLSLDFICAPIIIKDFSWVCAKCFIMMGITIETGCIVGATSSLFNSTEPWGVYGGIPAKFIKKRTIKQTDTNNEQLSSN